jgi:hypothetical protein
MNLSILLLDIFSSYFLRLMQIHITFYFHYFATEEIMHHILRSFAVFIFSPTYFAEKSICLVNIIRFFSKCKFSLAYYDSMHLARWSVKSYFGLIMGKFDSVITLIDTTC